MKEIQIPLAKIQLRAYDMRKEVMPDRPEKIDPS